MQCPHFHRLHKRAFDSYGYGRVVGTETGVRTSVQGKLYCDMYRTLKILRTEVAALTTVR